jgi:hypothetical protein
MFVFILIFISILNYCSSYLRKSQIFIKSNQYALGFDEDVEIIHSFSEQHTHPIKRNYILRDSFKFLQNKYYDQTPPETPDAVDFNNFIKFLYLSSSENNIINLIEICEYLNRADSPDSQQLNIFYQLILNFKKRLILRDLLRTNHSDYVEVVKFLGSQLSRKDLPNTEGIPYFHPTVEANDFVNPSIKYGNRNGLECILPDKEYHETFMDKFLLTQFRKLMQKEFNYTSLKDGIEGMAEEGRYYMLSKNGTIDNQHKFVDMLLEFLITPVIPPIYRIVVAGIVPSIANGDPLWLENFVQNIISIFPIEHRVKFKPGTQLGPWPYAPYLTSLITPLFMNFLVGPSKLNYRKDGQLGGILVEKCKSLQASGCKGRRSETSPKLTFNVVIIKGLCVNQCKVPVESFIRRVMGIPLAVKPNFETQECQWSFGEVPVPLEDDPTIPSPCLTSCPSRSDVKLSHCQAQRKRRRSGDH